ASRLSQPKSPLNGLSQEKSAGATAQTHYKQWDDFALSSLAPITPAESIRLEKPRGQIAKPERAGFRSFPWASCGRNPASVA
ncbi:MAG: hypothetical protein ACLGP3_07955, partial [Acidobacteriota bacterium]